MTNYNKNKKEFFDDFAKRYVGANPLKMTYSSEVEFGTFYEFFDLSPRSNVIELGCGGGRFVVPLLDKGHKVTGVDISQQALDILAENARRLGLESGLDLLKNDFQKPVFREAFDAAFVVSTFHQLDDTHAGRLEIFSNLLKSVKPGREVLLLQPNSWNPLFYIFALHPDVDWKIEKTLLSYSFRSLKKIYQDLGLKNIELQHFGWLPTRFVNKFRFVKGINEFLCRIPIVKNFSSFVLIKGTK